jgi:mevalonate kinase
MKPTVQKTIKSDWWSQAQILKLLRALRKADVLVLADHPIANSNIVRLNISQQGLKQIPYNIGLAISELIISLLKEKLNEARKSIYKTVQVNESKEFETKEYLLKIDAKSNNNEIVKWSLLVHHYIYDMSIQYLTGYFDYSTRQILYYLHEARNDFSRILLEKERAQTAKIDVIAPIAQKRHLSKDEQEELLFSLDYAYSAPCSAFIWGDWSALVSKKAIIVPIDKRVQVGIKSNVNGLSCYIFEWHDTENSWIFNEWHSAKMTDVLLKSWKYLSNSIYLESFDIYVFSDIHFGYGIHESTAMFASLASCLKAYMDNINKNEWNSSLVHLAFLLESFWYPEVTGVTSLCAFQSPNTLSVMLLDRTDDGDIDFKKIASRDIHELERSRAIDPENFHVTWLDFDMTKLIGLLYRFVTLDLDQIHKSYVKNLHKLERVGFDYLCEIMKQNIENLDYEKIGSMMNMHQALLSLTAFAPPGLHEILRNLRAVPNILGVKPSCSRPYGAYIALVEGDPGEVIDKLPEWIHPMSPFLTPTPGVICLLTNKSTTNTTNH